jgi:hypothetical protein
MKVPVNFNVAYYGLTAVQWDELVRTCQGERAGSGVVRVCLIREAFARVGTLKPLANDSLVTWKTHTYW